MGTVWIPLLVLCGIFTQVLCDRQRQYYSQNAAHNYDASQSSYGKNVYDYNSEYVRRVVRAELDSFKRDISALLAPDRQTSHTLNTLSQQIQGLSQRIDSLMHRQPQNSLTHQIEQRFQSWFQHLESRAQSEHGQCQNVQRSIMDLNHKMDYLQTLVTQSRSNADASAYRRYDYNSRTWVSEPRDDDTSGNSASSIVRPYPTEQGPEGSRSSAIFAGSYYDQRRANQLQGQRLPGDSSEVTDGDRSSSREESSVEVRTPRPPPTPRPTRQAEKLNVPDVNQPKQNYWTYHTKAPTKPPPTPVRWRPRPTVHQRRRPEIAKPYILPTHEDRDDERNENRGTDISESRAETDHRFIYPKYFENPSPTPRRPTPRPRISTTYRRNRNWSRDSSRRSYWTRQEDEQEDDKEDAVPSSIAVRGQDTSSFQAHQQYGTCPSFVTGLGERETLRRALDTIIGTWMKDTGENNGKVWAVEGANALNWKNILEYSSESNFKKRISSEYHELPEACSGLGAVIYKDHLYCQAASGRKSKAEIIKYSFEEERVVARGRLEPPGGTEIGVPYRGWAGIYLHVQLMVDEKGMWAISGESHTKRLVIFSIDPDTLDILHVYRTTKPKDLIGPSFMACGVLYATDSHYAVSVRYAFDTNTRKEKNLAAGQFTFPFMDLITIQYNPMDRNLYGWQVSRKELNKKGTTFHRSRGPRRKLYGLADRIIPKISYKFT